MSVQLSPDPVLRFCDNNNNPLNGGMLYTYQAGTTTPAATYTDSTGSTPNPNPVVLNARGEASVWLLSAQAYKLALQDANGNQIWSQDQIPGGGVASASVNTSQLVNGAVTLQKMDTTGLINQVLTGQGSGNSPIWTFGNLAANGITTVSTSETLPNSIAGGTVVFNPIVAITDILPAAVNVPSGLRIELLNISIYPVTINTGGTGPDTIAAGALSQNSIVIPAGNSAVLESNGLNTYYLVSWSAQALAPNFNAAAASNALTGTLQPYTATFRNSALGTGGVIATAVASALSLTIPSGASLGSIAAVQSTFVWALLYNGGSPVLAVTNLSGGLDMSETGLISTTAISTGATAANVWYSAAAVTNSPYRIVGVTVQTEATAGVYATPPTLVQPVFGEALAAMQSLGHGQTWQGFTSGARASGTTYYNTTAKPITVVAVSSVTGATSAAGYVNGFLVVALDNGASGYTNSCCVTLLVPPGASYSATLPNWASWSELR